MVLDWFLRNSSQRDKNVVLEDPRQIIAKFKEWSPRILTIPEVIPVIRFDEVISFFDTERLPSSSVTKILIRQRHHEGELLAQIFLNENNEFVLRPDGTPYGRQLVAKRFDTKLNDTFGNRDVVILHQKTSKDTVEEFHQSILSHLNGFLQDLLQIREVVPVMTYESAIKYFVAERPSDSRVVKGAIIRERHQQGYHIFQVFLDSHNNPVCLPNGKPYGRQLVAKELDEELRDTFGRKNLMIVE